MENNIWNITVDNSSDINSQTFDSGSSSSHFCGVGCNHTWYTGGYTSYYPNTIYMYQIKCPSCKKMNWAQLETTVECKNDRCKASLRAVTSKPEHIIEVEA